MKVGKVKEINHEYWIPIKIEWSRLASFTSHSLGYCSKWTLRCLPLAALDCYLNLPRCWYQYLFWQKCLLIKKTCIWVNYTMNLSFRSLYIRISIYNRNRFLYTAYYYILAFYYTTKIYLHCICLPYYIMKMSIISYVYNAHIIYITK